MRKNKLASFSGIGYSKLPQGTEILSSANGDIELKPSKRWGTFVTIVIRVGIYKLIMNSLKIRLG